MDIRMSGGASRVLTGDDICVEYRKYLSKRYCDFHPLGDRQRDRWRFADGRYLPLCLRRDLPDEGLAADRTMGREVRPAPPGPAPLSDLVRDAAWGPRNNVRMAVRAGAGCGKTLLLRHLCWQASDGAAGPLLPVYFRLKDLLRWWRDGDVKKAGLPGVVEQKRLRTSLTGTRLGGSLWPRIDDGARAWITLCLDAVEEVHAGKQERADFLLWLRDGLDDWKGPAVVTTREGEFGAGSLGDFEPYRVVDFAPADVVAFLASRVGGSVGGELAPQLQESLHTPLMLEIVAALRARNASFELPAKREDLYREAVKLLIARRAPFDGDDDDADDLREKAAGVVEWLGWTWLEAETSDGQISARRLETALRRALRGLDRLPGERREPFVGDVEAVVEALLADERARRSVHPAASVQDSPRGVDPTAAATALRRWLA